MLGAILGALNPIQHIADAIAKERIAAHNATTDQGRIAAEERAKALEARRDVLVAESRMSPINSYIRAALALPVVILLWKVFVFDKVLGQWLAWRTDALDDNLWRVVMIVIGFYFLYEAASSVSRIVKRG